MILFVAKPLMPEIRSIEIYGWIPYDKAWELGVPSDYDKDTRLIGPDMLCQDLPYDP